MNRGMILVVTERERVRDLFVKAVADPSRLIFERYLSAVQKRLSMDEVVAVFADHRISLASGIDVLKWVHRENPWIPLVLLHGEGEPLTEADPSTRQFVHFEPMPDSVERIRRLLDTFLGDGEEIGSPEPIVVEDWDISTENADREIIRSIVQCIDQLPALPVVVQRIQDIITREETSVKDISDVIALDPALAGRVLRLVNSALYSLANPVTTIEHAVALLGYAEVKNLTLTLKVMDAFSEWGDGVMDRKLFWEHSLSCGICARHLSAGIGRIQPDEAFLGGLLHDIGKLVLDTYFQDQWKQIQSRAREEDASALELEEKIVGIPHTVIGEYLARHWQFPDLHQIAIRHHHRIPLDEPLEPDQRAYCAIIFAANELVRWMDMGSSGYSPLVPLSGEAVSILGTDERIYEQALHRTMDEVGAWKENLGISHRRNSGVLVASGSVANPIQDIWIIAPRRDQIPSLGTLLRTCGYRVRSSHWGEKILSLLDQTPHQALLMDVRGVRVDVEKFPKFLLAARKRSSAPILILASNGLEQPPGLESEGIYCTKEPPHKGLLVTWLENVQMGL